MDPLERDGYVVLAGLLDAGWLAELRERVEQLYTEEADRAGHEFKQEPGCRRLANLVNKGEVFRRVLSHPGLLGPVARVLGPDFKLSSFNARSANANSSAAQPLHADMGAVADEHGDWVCNCLLMLDDFTPTNGATRVVPGTHRLRKLPQEVLADPWAPHPDEILLTGPAGTAIVYNAHLWHGGTANRSPAPRRALHVFFARRDKPQQQYQKRLLDADLQQSLAPELRRLLALDDPQNDALCAGDYVRSGFLK
jgi:ectoine hydroxylase-related dioxygenase (phytanoyl-CoA dioxygenase family)